LGGSRDEVEAEVERREEEVLVAEGFLDVFCSLGLRDLVVPDREAVEVEFFKLFPGA